MAYKKILVEKDAALPLRTAAKELAAATGAGIIRVKSVDGKLGRDVILLVDGDRAAGHKPASALLKGAELDGREWELAAGGASGGLVISGSGPRNICRAALNWIENPKEVTGKLTTFRFAERFTMWDNSLNQWYRNSRGFNRRQHIRSLALRGFTAVELNRYADPEGWFVRNRKFPGDSYPWYVSYAPALDQFVESRLTSGLYPKKELQRNLADLLEAAAIAKSYGLEAGFVCYEPRCVNEKIFDKYPHLRGARTDHPGRSLEPRYTLDVAHPDVLEHYAEMLKKLMKKVPLRYFVFYTNDSGSGFPFARHLYPGPNGSYLAKSKLMQDVVAGWAGTLAETGRRINPRFEVLMEIGWEYTDREREEITRKLPDGVNVTHPLGVESTIEVGGRKLKTYGGYQADRTAGLTREFVAYDLSMGKYPYGEIFLSNWWDYEPVIGIPSPRAVVDKFAVLKELNMNKVFARGGVLSPPQCPWSLNDELFSRLIEDNGALKLVNFLQQTAARWCGGKKAAAASLVEAWKTGETAQERWPVLFWYMKGSGTTQGRWLTRPLVPDITRLKAAENKAWTRKVFTLESDIGRQNLFFEGNVRIFDEKKVEWAVRVFDGRMLPLLEETVDILDEALKQNREIEILHDQRDRFYGLLLLMRTYRNSLSAQASINRWLLEPSAQTDKRNKLAQAIDAEIDNTRDWLRHLQESKTVFFRSAGQETPFLHSTPVKDLEVRLRAMEAHRNDQPGPDLPQLRDGGNYNSTWRTDWTAEK
ncbi:MAG: hypothetical protein FVQ81_08005 [Candidatus Glassbacteria bacterium]|nr:hypothetical protein [Candidatus Glassbacteria bacterium]